jgi:hypothetical protein
VLPVSADDAPMTTITAPTTSLSRTTGAAARLRLVLLTNAGTSAAAGLAAVVAPGAVGDLLGIAHTGWVRAVGAGLVLFALDIVLGVRSSRYLANTALITSVADLAWVVGTVAVVAAGDLTTTGRVLAVVMGIGVLDFALLQLWFRRAIDR